MLAGFGAISLSVLFFFAVYRFQGLGDAVDKVVDILNPFIYGSIIAYLLRPICNWYDDQLTDILPVKLQKISNPVAVILSMLTGCLVVYLLLIMILPELYTSIQNIWITMPDRVQSFLDWATVTFGENEQLLQMVESAYEALYTSIDTWAKNTLMPYVTNIVSGVGYSVLRVLNFLLDFLIGIIVAVYLLLSRKRFSRQGVMLVRSTLPPRWADLELEEIRELYHFFGHLRQMSDNQLDTEMSMLLEQFLTAIDNFGKQRSSLLASSWNDNQSLAQIQELTGIFRVCKSWLN